MAERSITENPLFGALLGQHMKQGADYGQLVEMQNQAINEKDKMLIGNILAIMDLQKEVASLKSTVQELNSEMDDMHRDSGTMIYGLTGVRSVVRELLSELRRADKNNPLLDKSVRDSIWEKTADKIESGLDSTDRKDLLKFCGKSGREVMGTNDTQKGGPSKDQISSNTALRKELGVPDHIPESQRLMGLVNILHKELQEANPDSPVLNDKAMIDLFEEYALHEMVKQDEKGNGPSTGRV